jgi:hypothetical protein
VPSQYAFFPGANVILSLAHSRCDRPRRDGVDRCLLCGKIGISLSVGPAGVGWLTRLECDLNANIFLSLFLASSRIVQSLAGVLHYSPISAHLAKQGNLYIQAPFQHKASRPQTNKHRNTVHPKDHQRKCLRICLARHWSSQ